MHSYSATDPDVISDIFTVTPLNSREGYITIAEAFKWAFKIIREATKEAETSFEGELYKVIPLKKTVTGMQFKLHFMGVPEKLMSIVIIPAFEGEGPVTNFQKIKNNLIRPGVRTKRQTQKRGLERLVTSTAWRHC